LLGLLKSGLVVGRQNVVGDKALLGTKRCSGQNVVGDKALLGDKTLLEDKTGLLRRRDRGALLRGQNNVMAQANIIVWAKQWSATLSDFGGTTGDCSLGLNCDWGLDS
jgi:hypothetical protein